MNTGGLAVMLGIQLRTGWKAMLAWVLALGATMVATTTSISGLYGTQRKIDSYAAAVGSGDALMAINGRIYGIDTLGGVVANEFGFVASFALPLMGISLIARSTRRDEESGRLEIVLAGRIGRTAPLVAAALVAAAALLLTSAALAAGLVAVGVPVTGSIVYAASLGALGFCFAGIAAVAAQVVQYGRGVYAAGLAALVLAYLLRGAGDVLDNFLTWLSPLGWAEEARAFGDPRWWPVLMALAVGLALLVVAAGLSGARDLGDALLRRGASAPVASGLLRSPTGFAVALHRGAVVGWSIGAIVVSAVFGALAQQLIDAMAGNESLADALGGSADADGFLAMSVLLLALISGGYAVQAVGTLRAEESTGRLEPVLAGAVDRRRWLLVHLCTMLTGLVVVAFLGALALGIAAAWSTGDASETGRLVAAVASYLPAILVLDGVALLA
ncbi:MAG: ABC transporter permease, partial [Nocardioidaceae bacterium]